MSNPLADPNQWVLSIVGGIVGAICYSQIDSAWRWWRWRRVRVARLGDLWKELMWIHLMSLNNKWRPSGDGAAGARGIFRLHALELQTIAALVPPRSIGIEPEHLSASQSQTVGTHLPGIRRLVPPVIDLLETYTSSFQDAWTRDDLEHFAESLTALKRFVAWQPVEKFAPGTAGNEIWNGVTLGVKALVALNWLSIIAEDNLKDSLEELERRHELL